jgi:hypothetical protein
MDIVEAKDLLSDYFNGYRSEEEIDELLHFLAIPPISSISSKATIVLCSYAERYFLHRLARKEAIAFERPLQEIIDFEFLKRKLDGVKLTDSLQRLLATLEDPINNGQDQLGS